MYPSEGYRFCWYDLFAFSIDHNGICNTHSIFFLLDRGFLAPSSGERNFTLQGFAYADERPCLTESQVLILVVQRCIVTALTRPLTREDTITDERWINGSVILCTCNIDRAVLNSCMATEITRCSQKLLFRWRKPLLGDVPQSAQELLHNEKSIRDYLDTSTTTPPGKFLTIVMEMSILALQMELGAGTTRWTGIMIKKQVPHYV
ncbi:hypothetical protein JG688_00009216 [Phytophthora aleatoria]|uniref:Uncharacterized protein n=1 Tax=Phytophthora aleatoria TaxID=2496075 RepID=A0A8J5MFH2_9STRA|nr:hypothetical protein JG688_00009216 [Phytophthora aleatoria]